MFKLRSYWSIGSTKVEYNVFKGYEIKTKSKSRNENKVQAKIKRLSWDELLGKTEDFTSTNNAFKYIKTKGKSMYLDISKIGKNKHNYRWRRFMKSWFLDIC